MEFIYSDGGRSNYFKAPNVRDCVTRAICNATGLDYKVVYDDLNNLAKSEKTGKRKRGTSSSRNGVYKGTIKKYLEGQLGWIFVPCMTIGSGCTTHLCTKELPKKGNYILSLSGHLSCWKDGKLYDTYDCSRDGSRCVYGYWRAPSEEEVKAHNIVLKKLKDAKDKELALKEEINRSKKIIKKNFEPKIKKVKSSISKLQRQLAKLEKEMKSEIEKAKLTAKEKIIA